MHSACKLVCALDRLWSRVAVTSSNRRICCSIVDDSSLTCIRTRGRAMAKPRVRACTVCIYIHTYICIRACMCANTIVIDPDLTGGSTYVHVHVRVRVHTC